MSDIAAAAARVGADRIGFLLAVDVLGVTGLGGGRPPYDSLAGTGGARDRQAAGSAGFTEFASA